MAHIHLCIRFRLRGLVDVDSNFPSHFQTKQTAYLSMIYSAICSSHRDGSERT